MRHPSWQTFFPIGGIITILLLVLFTWAGSIYGMDIVNLLSADGIRWMFSSVVPNIVKSPLPMFLLGLMTISALHASGLLQALRGHTNPKQKNALIIAMTVLALFAVALALLTLLPSATLLSPFSTFSHSPFLQGIPSISLIAIITTADIYGYTSGRLSSMADVINANTQLISGIASYFLTFIIIAQMVAYLDYSQVFNLICEDTTTGMQVFEYTAYLIPLTFYLIDYYRE